MLSEILTSNDSPQQIAAGAALGTFIAFTPTLGVQMLLVVGLATYLRVSRIPGLLMVYISNPLTMGPIYWSAYVVGVRMCRFVGMEVVSLTDFMEAFERVHELSGMQMATAAFGLLGRYGARMAVPLLLGSVVAGAVAGAITYSVVLRIVVGHRAIHAQKEARKIQRKAQALESEGAEAEEGPDESGALAFAPPETEQDSPNEPRNAPRGGTGTDPMDPPPEADAAGGDRRAG